MTFAQQLTIFPVKVYQRLLRPFLHLVAGGPCCRFTPSCSNYFIEAVKTHGPLKGSWIGSKRICSCHPLNKNHGYDPVPPRAIDHPIKSSKSC